MQSQSLLCIHKAGWQKEGKAGLRAWRLCPVENVLALVLELFVAHHLA